MPKEEAGESPDSTKKSDSQVAISIPESWIAFTTATAADGPLNRSGSRAPDRSLTLRASRSGRTTGGGDFIVDNEVAATGNFSIPTFPRSGTQPRLTAIEKYLPTSCRDPAKGVKFLRTTRGPP